MSPILANIYLHDVLDQWFIENYASKSAVIVRYDEDVPIVKAKLKQCRVNAREATKWRERWALRLRRVLSLETAERKLKKDDRYARIDTWPWDE